MNARALRRLSAIGLVAAGCWIWTHHSDVVALILRQREVLLGRYSQGRFAALLGLTALLWTLAAALWTSHPLRSAVGRALMSNASAVATLLLTTYLAHFFHADPRYVEAKPPADPAGPAPLAGTIRHRPPGEFYELVHRDVPKQARSYPNPPPGYPDVRIRLTSDGRGFRNPSAETAVDIVAVGDSFVAGVNVSDEQTWTELLARHSEATVYNLGVGGGGPPTYLSNYRYFGPQLRHRVALFMVYEGNDFHEDASLPHGAAGRPSPLERLVAHLDFAFEASPVRLGLRRLSERLERIDASRSVPDYSKRFGWMPLGIESGGTVHYTSFEPKQLVALARSPRELRLSPGWSVAERILRELVRTSRENDVRPVILFAPTAPHVVLPLAHAAVTAEALRAFAAVREPTVPDAESFQRALLANLGGAERPLAELCRTERVDFLSLTSALRAAAASGRQVYYTYDQHWTPDGHAVVAEAVAGFLRNRGLL